MSLTAPVKLEYGSKRSWLATPKDMLESGEEGGESLEGGRERGEKKGEAAIKSIDERVTFALLCPALADIVIVTFSLSSRS